MMKKHFVRVLALFILCLVLSTGSVPVMAYYGEPYYAVVYATEGEGLALKEAPDIDSFRYLLIPEGTALVISKVSENGWGYTSYGGYVGWVSLKYTRITERYTAETPTYGWVTPVYYTIVNTQGEGLELRSRPTTESSTFGPIYDGTNVEVTAIQGNWAYVCYNELYGWCYMDYMRVSDVQSTPKQQRENPAAASGSVLQENDGWTDLSDTSGDRTLSEEASAIDPRLVGSWEYKGTQFDVQFRFYRAGYCFYEDGTGLDVFWDKPFHYTASDGVLEIQFDHQDYSLGKIYYNIEHREDINGIHSLNGFDILYFEYEDIDSDGDSFLHIPEDVFSQDCVMEGNESRDSFWLISTEDGESVSINNHSIYYGYNEPRVIPAKIDGHPVKTVKRATIGADRAEYIIVEEGIETIEEKAFADARALFAYLPDSLQYIADDAFYYTGADVNNRNRLLIMAPEGSYAESYAKEHDLRYLPSVDNADPIQLAEQYVVEEYEKYADAADFYVRVNSEYGHGNILTKPGTPSMISGDAPNGQELHITDFEYNSEMYGYTLFEGNYGWIRLEDTELLKDDDHSTPDFYVKVTADSEFLNFRQGAGTGYAVAGKIPNGSILHITDMEYNTEDGLFFGAAMYEGQNGWVSLRQTSILDSNAQELMQ